MKLGRHIIYLLLLNIVLCLCACGGRTTRTANKEDETSEALGLEIYRDQDCWVAKVISPTDSTKDLGVYIFPDKEDCKNIPDIEGAYIFPPSRRGRVMLYSSVYSSALKELGSQELIKVAGDVGYMSDRYVLEGLKSGEITDGGLQAEPNQERIIAARPDMIIISHYDGMDPSKLEKLGIPVIYMRESSEQEPLGRAEWIKLIGLIAGKKEAADSIYSQVKNRYQAMVKKASGIKGPKPSVMTETMYQGSWFVSGGQSYAAKMIRDAGGRYIMDDDKSAGSLTLSFESVLEKSADADIWLIKSYDKDLTLKELETQDSRYMLFKPAKTGGVWNVNSFKVPFYEETPFHPELLLQDYIRIFHPEVFKDGSTKYFRPVK